MVENLLSKRDKPKFSHDRYLYVFGKQKVIHCYSFGDANYKKNVNSKHCIKF